MSPSKFLALPALKKLSPGNVSTPFIFAAFLSPTLTTLTPNSSSSGFLVSRRDETRSQVRQFFPSVKGKINRSLFAPFIHCLCVWAPCWSSDNAPDPFSLSPRLNATASDLLLHGCCRCNRRSIFPLSLSPSRSPSLSSSRPPISLSLPALLQASPFTSVSSSLSLSTLRLLSRPPIQCTQKLFLSLLSPLSAAGAFISLFRRGVPLLLSPTILSSDFTWR